MTYKPHNPEDELAVRQAEPAYNRERLYTIEDWLSWDERTFRSELHDGMLVVMTYPDIKHQHLSGEIYVQLHAFLKGKTCKAFYAPIGVRPNKNENTIFLPDIVVICDKSKLEDGRICNGAPDMVVEILSPSTSRIDRVYKFNKYLESGVPEYWIVDPEQDTVQVNILQNGNYITRIYDKTDTVSVTVLESCEIALPDVFAE